MNEFNQSENLLKIQYALLPGNCPPNFPQVHLHNLVFSYWKEFWEEVFVKNGVPGHLQTDDFYRSNFISVLYQGHEVIGLGHFGIFNLESMAAQTFGYFQRSFTPSYMDFLRKRNIKSVLSFEHLTINPSWRKSKVGVPFAKILLALHTRLLKALNIDAAVAISRSDVKVTDMLLELQWDVVVPNLNAHNTPVDLAILLKHRVAPHPEPDCERLVENYWRRRQDFTGQTYMEETDIPLRKAG